MIPRLRSHAVFSDWSHAKIVGDGNSMMIGTGLPTPAIHNVLRQAMTGSALAAAAYANVAIGGQTARQMNGLDGGSALDVQAAFDVTKVANFLVIRDGTNSIASGRTGEQAATDLAEYCVARRGERAWNIVVLLTPPIGRSYWTTDQQTAYNQKVDIFNQWWRDNWGDAGVRSIVDTRVSGSIFGPENFPDYTTQRFIDVGDIWEVNSPVVYVHLNKAGYAIEAAALRAALLSIRAR